MTARHGDAEPQRSFHEKAAPCQECFALSMSSSLFFPFSQAASVATLPSALLYERVFARCQLGVLDSVGAAT